MEMAQFVFRYFEKHPRVSQSCTIDLLATSKLVNQLLN